MATTIDAPRTPTTPQRPQRRTNWEKWGWIYMRASGVLLVILIFGHLFVNLVAAICFHAINGLRIILVDLWGWATDHQRLLFWLVVVIWIVLVAGFVPVQIVHMTQEVH